MENVMTPIGMIGIFDSRDIYEIAERFVSEDYARVIRDMVETEKADAEERAWSSYDDALRDAIDEVDLHWRDSLKSTHEVLSVLYNNVNTMTKYELQNALFEIIQTMEDYIYK